MMNAQDHANQLAKAMDRLAKAQRFEILAKKHRLEAMRILKTAQRSFDDLLEVTKEARRVKLEGQETEVAG